MRTGSVALVMAMFAATVGCASGSRVRTPSEWHDEMTAQFKPRVPELRKCYLGAGAPAGKKIEVQVNVFSTQMGQWWIANNKHISATSSENMPKAYKEPYHVSVGVHADIDLSHGKFDIGGTSSSTDYSWWPRLQRCIEDTLEKVAIIPDDKNDGSAEWTVVYDPAVTITD
jgi:hypothetical protein